MRFNIYRLFVAAVVCFQLLPVAAQSLSALQQLKGPLQTPAPRAFDTQHYQLRTRFDRAAKTVFGDEIITLKPLAENFQEVRLHAAGLTIDAITLSDTTTKLQWRQEKPDKLVVKLNRAYDASETIALRIVYRAVKPKRGIYFTPEASLSLPRVKLRRPPQIWTQNEPEDARYWFVAHDYPDDLATTEQFITTTAPAETTIANGKLLETHENTDKTKTFHWRMEQPHAVYLTSLVVGEFVKIEDVAKLSLPDGSERSVPLEFYTYAGGEKAARNAYANTAEIIRHFSKITGYPFPFNRYAQTGVAFFTQFAGMENITATTLADSLILRPTLFRGENADLLPPERLEVDNLVAHEIAHSWFGNLVTCRDWSHLWLNEGLSTFMEAVWQEKLAGEKAYMREMRVNQDLYLAEDRFSYRRPLVTNRYQDPSQMFDSTTYKKGGYVIHMLRRLLGDEVFWQAVNHYLTAYSRQNVTTQDLQRVFEESSGQKLEWFFQQWAYQAGHPELRVRYRYDTDKKELALTVQQTQKTDAGTPEVFRLPGVQVEITAAGGTRTETINITERSHTFTFRQENPPFRLLFDADERVLKELDYPQQPGNR
jgi:aminopeptidase N